MPALYPMMSAAEDFAPGDCVRKFITDRNCTPFLGTVCQIVPATQKVWVQWPTEKASESPETLVRVNPAVAGLPSALTDMGYSSYETERSKKQFGPSPLKPRPSTAYERMGIRVAHTFATSVVGKMVDEITVCASEGLSDIQAYDRTWRKFGSTCSDHVIRLSVDRVYQVKK